MTWYLTRDAIVAAVVAASGLSSVIWEGQDADQPALPYVAIAIGGLQEIGMDWVIPHTDLNRPEGQEIELAVTGWRDVSLELKVYTEATIASSTATDATAIGERIRSSLLLPSIRRNLATVGVVPIDSSPSNNVPPIVAIKFRGFALIDVRCYMAAETVSEYCGYIASLSGTITAVDTGTFAFSAPVGES